MGDLLGHVVDLLAPSLLLFAQAFCFLLGCASGEARRPLIESSEVQEGMEGPQGVLMELAVHFVSQDGSLDPLADRVFDAVVFKFDLALFSRQLRLSVVVLEASRLEHAL